MPVPVFLPSQDDACTKQVKLFLCTIQVSTNRFLEKNETTEDVYIDLSLLKLLKLPTTPPWGQLFAYWSVSQGPSD